jgi:hypothetical protein
MKCFACDRRLGRNPARVDTRDSQIVVVGSECFKHVAAAGDAGYQPPKGGPRLYLVRCSCSDPLNTTTPTTCQRCGGAITEVQS